MQSNIVLTGIGLVTPLGSSRETTWSRLMAGETGIIPTSHGLEAPVFDFSPNGARSRMGDFALLAAREALVHAGFDPDNLSGANIGCAVSQSKPLICHPEPAVRLAGEGSLFFKTGRSFVARSAPQDDNELDLSLLFSSFFGWSAELVVRREFGFDGPSANVVAACATGIASLSAASQWILSGECEMALAGAAESSLNSFYRAGFQQMGVLCEADEPRAVRPFDRRRSGFAMGEGAAVMVLESESSAKKRGRKPIARVAGVSLRQNSRHAIQFDPDGGLITRLIESVIRGKIPDYINAHGTGTKLNDSAEAAGMARALGKHPAMVSSTKAATGHLLGAAGAVEAAFGALAVERGEIPPTLNLEEPEAEFELDFVPKAARRAEIRRALSLSYGFGGQMGAVLFEKL